MNPNIAFDPICGNWKVTQEATTTAGCALVVSTYNHPFNTILETKYILPDGTITTTAPAGLNVCPPVEVTPPPIVPIPTTQFSFTIPAGVYMLSDLNAIATSSPYNDGKTTIHSIQFVAKESLGGQFQLDDGGITIPNGETLNIGLSNHDGTYLEEVSDFRLVVSNGEIEINVVMF